MSSALLARKHGFTLLELIITMVIGSILMAMVIPYVGTALTKSGSSLIALQSTLSVYQTMENLNADYQTRYDAGTLDLTTLQTSIGAAGSDQNNSFGTYHVVDNLFILFDAAGNEIGAGATQDILKVTIKGVDGGPFFTTLFSRDLP